MSDISRPAAGKRTRRLRTDVFWSSDWSLTILLILLAANIFALPLTLSESWGRLISRAAISLVIISGLHATVRSVRLILLGSLFTLAGFFIGSEDVVSPSLRLHVLNDVVALPLLGILVVLIARQLFRAGPITMHRVRGSIAVYLLIGLIWAIAYDLIEVVRPGSFRFGMVFHGGHLAALGYYSFTTLTTLGFGDILPLSPVARSLTVSEALVGQLFPAILIARLVSMEVVYHLQGIHAAGGE